LSKVLLFLSETTDGLEQICWKMAKKVFIRNKISESKERMSKEKRNKKILINTDVRTMVDDAHH